VIGYIEGRIFQRSDEKVLIIANQIGYEVLLPTIVQQSLKDRSVGDSISLFIYYHQTEKQPKPVLIGFNTDEEKEFFQRLITVDDIGPLKAAKALTVTVNEIASAVESNDIDKLQQLKGIGKRTAQKMIASLAGKLEKFISPDIKVKQSETHPDDLVQPVMDILVDQLGIKLPDAKRMISDTLAGQPSINTPEALLEHVLRAKPK
jgi:holliday junction DNA helicase RuvA